MEGVVNIIREFSSDFTDMRKLWKYTVEMYEEGIEIKYLENIDGIMEEKQNFNISASCAELLFKTIAKDFDNGAFDSNL